MAEKNSNPKQFKRALNLFDATAIVVGSMIGSGIFIVSADMARTLGSPGLLLAAWVLTAVITVLATLCYGELAALFPKAGGQYVYLKESYGMFPAFLYGWAMFMVIQTGTIAAVAVAFAKFTGVLIPFVSQSNIWLDLGFIRFDTAQLLAIASIVALTLINLNGINTGKNIQNVFTITKATVLLGLIVLGLFFYYNSDSIQLNSQIFWEPASQKDGGIIILAGWALIVAIGTSMVGSLFSSDAWNNVTFIGGEIKNPGKTIPISMFLGTVIVSILFILANVAYINILPLRGDAGAVDAIGRGIQYAAADRVGTAAVQVVIGNAAAIVMAIFIMISTFGCNNGLILSGARVYYAMASDGLFFKKVGMLNGKGVPGTALIAQCIWASLLCLSGTYGNLLDYIIFTVLLFYVLTVAGIFVLRIKKPELERPYKAIGYPVLPALYIALAAFIMLILLIYKPTYSWPGLIIVALGVPIFFVWRGKGKG